MANNGTNQQESATHITPKQQRAVTALLSAPTVQAAAVQAKVGVRTLHTWLRLEPFQDALLEAESAAIEAATRRLISLQGSAIEVLEALLSDPNIPAGVRLRAAQSVIDILLRLRELRNIESRLSALEAAILYPTKER